MTHGFLDDHGTFTSLDDPNAEGNTMLLGINNLGSVVGSYVDASGVTNEFLYDPCTNHWVTIDDLNQSVTPVFGITETTINGVNSLGDLVGFYRMEGV